MQFIHVYLTFAPNARRYTLLAMCLAIFPLDAAAQDKAQRQILNWIRVNGGEYDREGSDQTVVNLRLDRTRGMDSSFAMESIRDDIPSLIPHLLKLKNLRGLRLGKAATKSILDEVLGISSLDYLDLSDCNLPELGFSSLQRLEHLNSLSLMRDTLDAEVLRILQGLPELRRLWLAGAIFPDGLQQLGRLSKLEELRLNYTTIGDEELGQLSEMTQLRSLWIDSTRISKASLEQLAKLPKLQFLSLLNNGIVEADLINFKAAHPKCMVLIRE